MSIEAKLGDSFEGRGKWSERAFESGRVVTRGSNDKEATMNGPAVY